MIMTSDSILISGRDSECVHLFPCVYIHRCLGLYLSVCLCVSILFRGLAVLCMLMSIAKLFVSMSVFTVYLRTSCIIPTLCPMYLYPIYPY